MSKHLLAFAIILLSIAMFFVGFQIWNSSNKNEENLIASTKQVEKQLQSERGLMTNKEAAVYLSISAEEFDKLISKQDYDRSKNTVFETYQYIPYVDINGKKYFSKELLNEWIKYNSVNWIFINE